MNSRRFTRSPHSRAGLQDANRDHNGGPSGMLLNVGFIRSQGCALEVKTSIIGR